MIDAAYASKHKSEGPLLQMKSKENMKSIFDVWCDILYDQWIKTSLPVKS